jgi:hypothetical protein
LIAALAREAVPVAPVGRLWPRLGVWLGAAIVAAAAGVAAIGPRPDLAAQVRTPAYLLTLGLTGVAGIAAAAAALAMGIPDDRRSPLVWIAPLLVAAGWGALIAGRLLAAGDVIGQLSRDATHAACFFQIGVSAMIPAAVLVRQVRRTAPLDVMRTGLLAALGSLGVAAAGAQIACPYDAPAHLLVWHVASVAGLAALSLLWARPALGRVAR